MECEEPSTGLVDTLCDEISRICTSLVDKFTVLKRIMNLGIWHCTRIEPHINEVKLTCQHITALTDKFDIVDIWTMNINAVIILLAHITRDEPFLLQRV